MLKCFIRPRGRVAIQRSAKPRTPVQIRSRPPSLIMTIELFPGQGTDTIEKIFVQSLEQHKLLQCLDTNPDYLFGYSYGLYAALAAAGVLPKKDVLMLAKIREKLVLDSERFAEYRSFMLSVFGIDRLRGKKLAEEYGLYVSNDNGPSLQVLSGYEDSIKRLENDASGLGIRKTRRLQVVGAYHVPTKERKKDSRQYARMLDFYQFHDPKIPLISSTKPRVMMKAEDIKIELAAQMTRPVEMVKAVNLWLTLGVDMVIEAGGGDIKKLVSKINPRLS